MNYKNYIKINIDNLKYNMFLLKQKYKFSYYIMDVSNNAFNHKMEIINFLDDAIDYLYVNSFKDVTLIKKYNNKIPVIFEGLWSKDNILDFINQNVILVINNLNELEEINNLDLFDKINIILNIDINGLLGFSEKSEISKAAEIIKRNNKINLYGIKAQIKEKEYAQFLYLINPITIFELQLSILNNEEYKDKINDSNAIILNKSIYGINNKVGLFNKEDKVYKQVIELYSQVINIKKEIKGKKEKYYAIIPYGLLDGMSSKITKLVINNRLFNILVIKDRYMVVLVDNTIKIEDKVIISSYDNPFDNYLSENILTNFNVINNNLPVFYNNDLDIVFN